MQNNTLSPSTRTGQNASSSFLAFFPLMNLLILTIWTGSFFQIFPLFPPSSKYPVQSGNKKKFRENDRDSKDTFQSDNCCYPLFMKHRWRVKSRSARQFFCLFIELKHFFTLKKTSYQPFMYYYVSWVLNRYGKFWAVLQN